MQFRTLLCLAIALLGIQPLVAQAGPCDAYFTFDGNLADASGNGYDGVATGPAATSEKTAARLPYIMSFEQGKSGQALKLDGTTAVRVPLDLNIEGCPQITITAWVKFDDNPTKGSQYILSSGPGGPGLVRDGTNLSVYGGEKRHRQSKALRGGSWEFIAASLDYEGGKMTVHWRNRVSEIDIKAKGTKQADVWIGAYDDNARMAVQSGLIDDLRVTAGILTADQIGQLRNSVGQVRAIRDQTGLDLDHDSMANPSMIPGDQFEPAQIPGDQFEPTQIPGDQFEPAQIPGDQFEPAQIPGDQFEPAQIPGDQFEPAQIPGDQFEPGDSPPPATGQIHEPGQPAPSVLDSEAGTSTVLPGGRDLSSQTVQGMQEAGGGSTPLDITYDSEAEGEAAAAAAAEERRQNQAAEDVVEESSPPQAGGYTLDDEVVKSGLSGAVGTTIRPLDLGTEPVRQVLVERSDYPGAHIPDRVRIKGRTMSKYALGYMTQDCSDHESCSEKYDSVTLNEAGISPAGVTALDVCLTTLDNKVAGIELRGHVLTEDGAFAEYYQDTDKRGQCMKWSGLVACGLDHVATGVEVHFRETGVAANLPYKVTGLQLLCRRVIMN